MKGRSYFTFQIIEKCFQDANGVKFNPKVDFLLEESDWNDFDYYTTYFLHATSNILNTRDGRTQYLGAMHIMKIGQKKNEEYLLRKLYEKDKLQFKKLPENFVSLCADVDLYETLNRLLVLPEDRQLFDNSLHIILSETDKHFRILQNDECFNSSLLRDISSLNVYSIEYGRKVLRGNEVTIDLRHDTLKISLANVSSSCPLELNFNAIADDSNPDIPNGIIAFIGKNGSGKSTTLYQIAKILYASPRSRSLIANSVGKLEDNRLGISKLIMLSYSSFDNFLLPGNTYAECRTMVDNLKDHEGRFVFCGIRDVVRDMEEFAETNNNITDEDFAHKSSCDRLPEVTLKNPSSLAEEYFYALDSLYKDDRKQEIWIEIQKDTKNEQAELWETTEELMVLPISQFANNNKEKFNSLSTGYKFFLHALAHIVANCDFNNMILFDEPENHLQPPLLSFMLREIRKILFKYRSVMLISTHSPIVLQEIFAKNVRIVKRRGKSVAFIQPGIETYGESFGAITNEVFNLNSDNTRYYETADYLYNKWNLKNKVNTQDMLSTVTTNMGQTPSSQLTAYLISKYLSDKAK